MRVIAFVYVLCLAISGPGNRAFGQSGDCRIMISGQVTEPDTCIRIRHALVHLKADNGDMRECVTDSNGRYHFYYKKVGFNKAEISLVLDRRTASVYNPRPCGYLNTKDIGMIETKDSAHIYSKDFQLTPNRRCGGGLPPIRFKKNTVVFDTVYACYNDGLDSALSYPYESVKVLADLLKENPSITIELSGHCSGDERSPVQLSLQRAEQVKAELVKLGINKDRIKPVGYGAKKRLIKDDVIQRAQTKEEMIMLHAKNRRCVFRILSWDFPSERVKPLKPQIMGDEK